MATPDRPQQAYHPAQAPGSRELSDNLAPSTPPAATEYNSTDREGDFQSSMGPTTGIDQTRESEYGTIATPQVPYRPSTLSQRGEPNTIDRGIRPQTKTPLARTQPTEQKDGAQKESPARRQVTKLANQQASPEAESMDAGVREDSKRNAPETIVRPPTDEPVPAGTDTTLHLLSTDVEAKATVANTTTSQNNGVTNGGESFMDARTALTGYLQTAVSDTQYEVATDELRVSEARERLLELRERQGQSATDQAVIDATEAVDRTETVIWAKMTDSGYEVARKQFETAVLKSYQIAAQHAQAALGNPVGIFAAQNEALRRDLAEIAGISAGQIETQTGEQETELNTNDDPSTDKVSSSKEQPHASIRVEGDPSAILQTAESGGRGKGNVPNNLENPEDDPTPHVERIKQAVLQLYANITTEELPATQRSFLEYRNILGLFFVPIASGAKVLDIGSGNSVISAADFGLAKEHFVRADLFPKQPDIELANVLALPSKYKNDSFDEVWASFILRQMDKKLPDTITANIDHVRNASGVSTDIAILCKSFNEIFGLIALREMLRVTKVGGRIRLASYRQDFQENPSLLALTTQMALGTIRGLRIDETFVANIPEAIWQDANKFVEKGNEFELAQLDALIANRYKDLIPTEIATILETDAQSPK